LQLLCYSEQVLIKDHQETPLEILQKRYVRSEIDEVCGLLSPLKLPFQVVTLISNTNDGMITAPLLSLFVVPAIYLVWKRHYLI